MEPLAQETVVAVICAAEEDTEPRRAKRWNAAIVNIFGVAK